MVQPHEWPITSMPDEFEEALLNRVLSDMEYRALKQGFKPRDMDDRWFLYVQDDWLYLHRSWTGHCIFKVKVEYIHDNYTLSTLHLNRNPQQYKSTNADTDKQELNSVLNTFIALNAE